MNSRKKINNLLFSWTAISTFWFIKNSNDCVTKAICNLENHFFDFRYSSASIIIPSGRYLYVLIKHIRLGKNVINSNTRFAWKFFDKCTQSKQWRHHNDAIWRRSGTFTGNFEQYSVNNKIHHNIQCISFKHVFFPVNVSMASFLFLNMCGICSNSFGVN